MKRVLKKIAASILVCCLLAGILPTQILETEASSGTFTAVAMNVDGLPQKILGISINSDGPGSSGTTAMSQKIATYGWDLIGVSEDFNYHTELMSSLSSNYSSGTSRVGVSGLSNDTDGLNLIWKNSISVTGESWTGWEENYASGLFGTGNGADTMIDKGYRFYQATIAEGVTIDVYVLHMDADSDAEDIAAREAQLTQLATAIKSSNNGNPIIVIGDTNCRYTRENLKTLFIDTINADSRFTIQDTWIEKIRNNDYPVYGSDALVAVDKGGTYEYPQAEVVDKIFYINNTDSDVTLTLNSHAVATDFVDSSGTALADHWPIVAEFSYTVAGECEHDYVVTDSKDAACLEAGYVTYTCSKCDDTYTENIDALGHTEVKDAAVEATCTATGLTEGSHCDVCGTTIKAQSVVDALGHNYVNGVCERCDVTCEHEYKVTASKEATCEDAGYTTYSCNTCGNTYTEDIAATGHTEVVDAAVAATCTATGLTEGSHCSVCQVTISAQTVVDALGHDYVDGACSRCGEAEPECEHNYEVTASEEATCENAGYTTYTCNICGDAYTEDIAATGHTVVADKAVDATCTTTGLTEGSHCSVCNVTIVEQSVVDALEHNYVNGSCTLCGAVDPDYQPEEPSGTPVLGTATTELTDGKRYVITFNGTTGEFAMERNADGTIVPTTFAVSQGEAVTDTQIWTVKEQDGGYTISVTIDGTEYYLYRTKTFVGYGYKVALRADSPYVWQTTVDTTKGSIRFYDKTFFGSKYYLRYYSARVGWIATTRAAGLKVYQVNE